MISNESKITEIEVWMTKLWPYEVGAKKKRELQQRRDIVESVETEHPDVVTFGVGFKSIFNPF